MTQVSITITATSHVSNSLCPYRGFQKLSFEYKTKDKSISLFFKDGIIDAPELKIVIPRAELKRVLEFLTNE